MKAAALLTTTMWASVALAVEAPEVTGEDAAVVPTVDAAACVWGRQLACGCPGGGTGVQVCQQDGRSFGPCQCATEEVAAPAGAVETAAETTGEDRGPGPDFGVTFQVGASLDELALSGAIGGRYRFSDTWVVGLDVQWNPWGSFETKRFHPGVISFYATVIHRIAISKWVALTTSAHAGMSTLLFDLVSAPSGSTGIYAGLSLLGLEIKVAPRWRLVVEPADVALPVPHLTGAPLSYQQYKVTLGVLFGAGD